MPQAAAPDADFKTGQPLLDAVEKVRFWRVRTFD
jgi:hypothetical protein